MILRTALPSRRNAYDTRQWRPSLTVGGLTSAVFIRSVFSYLRRDDTRSAANDVSR
jgi:hypothetical protein